MTAASVPKANSSGKWRRGLRGELGRIRLSITGASSAG
jgi:hypothetical protein